MYDANVEVRVWADKAKKKIGFKSDWISLEDLITFPHPILAQANDAFG